MATKRDYYEILGVSKSATADEIKRAYRKLAMQHHPDKHGGDDAKFREVGEAYEILKDPQKRAGYDQFGHAGAQAGAGGPGGPFGGQPGGGYGFSGAQGFDFGDILNQFMGGFGGQQSGPARGNDIQVNMTIDFAEAVFGAEKKISLNLNDSCDRCGGKGAEPGTSLKTCPTCNGQGRVTRVQQTILGAIQQTSTCPACSGRGQVPEKPCTECHGTGVKRRSKDLDIKIPAGIDDNSTMRLAGLGEAPKGGGPKGDLYVNVRVRPDPRFRRDGRTIHSETSIPMAEAALGTQVEVETVDGPVTLKIPAGTQGGKVFKLSGRGVPGLSARPRGDHLVEVTVETPSKLSARQKELLEEFAADSGKKGFWKR